MSAQPGIQVSTFKPSCISRNDTSSSSNLATRVADALPGMAVAMAGRINAAVAAAFNHEIGMIPVRLTNPTVGFMPTMPLIDDGLTMRARYFSTSVRDEYLPDNALRRKCRRPVLMTDGARCALRDRLEMMR